MPRETASLIPDRDAPVELRDKPSTKKRLIFAGVIAFVVLFLAAVITIIAVYMSKSSRVLDTIRLPSSVTPQHYDISLTADLKNFKFSGQENITLTIHNTTDMIVIHAMEYNITNVRLRHDEKKKDWTPKSVTYQSQYQYYEIRFKEKLDADKDHSYVLEVSWSGDLSNTLVGFYRSQYTDNTGAVRWLATTHFEPVYARRAFPCFDEPAMKATFQISMTHDKNLIALSNMPEASSTVNGDWKTTRFEKSVKMSTYLVAFIVCDFKYVERITPSGIRVRVYARQGLESSAEFALDVGSRVLEFYNQYYAIPYPLPKLDMVAIPDFSSGAMENWGLVTYRETSLLVYDGLSSASDKQGVALTVAHELAHQWFGNLVTMEWWSDLWLNEGFATYVEYLGANHVFPDWKMDQQIFLNEVQDALSADSLNSTHAIAQNVSDPAQISQMFDSISYAKGASIIRMLDSFIGETKFREGLNLYLASHKFGNAQTADLWAAIGQKAGLQNGDSIDKIMTTWTNNIGHPLLTVNVAAGSKIQISQNRYFQYPTIVGNQTEVSTLWWVPTPISYERDPVKTYEYSIPLTRTLEQVGQNPPLTYEAGKWVKVNAGQSAFFRTLYKKQEMMDALKRQLVDQSKNGLTVLSNLDIAGFVSDSLSLGRSGVLSSSAALDTLDFLNFYRGEDYIVWATVTNELKSYSNLLDMQGCYGDFQTYALSLVKPAFNMIGWGNGTEDSHMILMLRAKLLSTLVDLEDEETINEAVRRYEAFNQDEQKNPLDPDIRQAVYNAVVKSGNVKLYNTIIDRYMNATFPAEVRKLLTALGYARSPFLIERSLRFSLSSAVRSQDAPYVFGSAGANPYAREATWIFIQENIKTIADRYGVKGGSPLTRTLTVISYFVDMFHYNAVQTFFEANPIPKASSFIAQSLEKIQFNSQWLASSLEDTCKYLQTK